MFGHIADFFKGLGHLVAKALGIVKDHVSDEQLAQAITLVKDAENKFLDNALRRGFVVKALMAIGMSESFARMTVELALTLVKKEASKATDKAVDAIPSAT
jgi:hypothetical protein